ncbi:hypothetical protein ACFL2Q_08360 [Thermodesulfobacteriota bacterium]
METADGGDLKPAYTTPVAAGIQILAESEGVKTRRQERLAVILANHPHACLTCAQREGCPRTQCSTNVPENERY